MGPLKDPLLANQSGNEAKISHLVLHPCSNSFFRVSLKDNPNSRFRNAKGGCQDTEVQLDLASSVQAPPTILVCGSVATVNEPSPWLACLLTHVLLGYQLLPQRKSDDDLQVLLTNLWACPSTSTFN